VSDFEAINDVKQLLVDNQEDQWWTIILAHMHALQCQQQRAKHIFITSAVPFVDGNRSKIDNIMDRRVGDDLSNAKQNGCELFWVKDVTPTHGKCSRYKGLVRCGLDWCGLTKKKFFLY
jgi:hypothetical protein